MHQNSKLTPHPQHLRMGDITPISRQLIRQESHPTNFINPTGRNANVTHVLVQGHRTQKELIKRSLHYYYGATRHGPSHNLFGVTDATTPHRTQNTSPQAARGRDPRNAAPHGHERKVYQSRRHPNLPQRDQILPHVLPVRLQTTNKIGGRRRRTGHNQLFRTVKRREVQQRVVDHLIQNHLFQYVHTPGHVFHLIPEAFRGEGCRAGKQSSEYLNVQSVLHSSQVEETERGKGRVTTPIDVFALFNHFLDEDVAQGGFHRGDRHAERERVLDWYLRQAGEHVCGMLCWIL
mmetsp:Transcript_19824/g.24437  ORF Transcript_19824/g.24437 Transcript_19824/m.24437 type:complete len:291 (+) Transcript_19824:579-1451(+)